MESFRFFETNFVSFEDVLYNYSEVVPEQVIRQKLVWLLKICTGTLVSYKPVKKAKTNFRHLSIPLPRSTGSLRRYDRSQYQKSLVLSKSVL